MKKFIFFFSISAALVSCGPDNSTEQKQVGPDPDSTLSREFKTFTESFIESLWKLYPGWASSQGYHTYDSVLVIPDDAFHKKELVFAAEKLEALKKFAPLSLNRSRGGEATDYFIIENMLNDILFKVNELREYEWNPASYNVSGTFAEILQNKNASNEEKVRVLYLRMANIPAYYANAKKMIKSPTIEHTGLAIDQNEGGLDVFTSMLMDSLKKCKMGAHESQMIEARIAESVKAIESYVAWMVRDLSPGLNAKTSKSFRLGKDLYEKKFVYDIQSRYTAEEIYKKAVERKIQLQKEMLEITKELFGKYFPQVRVAGGFTMAHTKMLIDEISKKHVHRDSFQTSIEDQIPELTKFVRDKNLLYLDPARPLVVRKEPAYMAGVAGASISAPGPYDKGGDTYYNVGSLSGYTPEGAESYLREYNHYILQILNIHEAIPGHYAQLVYSNQSPSMIKSLFGNGAMVEGWAVYTEKMMLENGYGNNEPEMWLMYYKWHLRSVCNTILDYSVHVLEMNKEKAIKFLVDEAFQQKQEAENKWRRVSVTQVQLTSYFTGYTEIYELREELRAKLGDSFGLKEFHEKFLSYGSSPVKYIRELMLEK